MADRPGDIDAGTWERLRSRIWTSFNRKHRTYGWGVRGGRFPSVVGFASKRAALVDGVRTLAAEETCGVSECIPANGETP